MTHILLQKQEPVFMITNSISQYPNIKDQTSDEIQSIETYEHSAFVFDAMLIAKQARNNDLFPTKGRPIIFDIYYISQSYFQLPKDTLRKNSNIFILFKPIVRDIKFFFDNIAGLDMETALL